MKVVFINTQKVELVHYEDEWFAAIAHIQSCMSCNKGNAKADIERLGGKAVLLTEPGTRTKYYTDYTGILLLMKHHNVDGQLTKLADSMMTGKGFENLTYAKPEIKKIKKKKKKKADLLLRYKGKDILFRKIK